MFGGEKLVEAGVFVGFINENMLAISVIEASTKEDIED